MENYYVQNQIPFDAEQGFSLARARKASPQWFGANLEKVNWGKWAQPGEVAAWSERQKAFLKNLENRPVG